MQKQREAAIPFILITVLIDVLGIGLIIPVLPTIIRELTQNAETQAYWYGVLAAVYGAMQFIFSPLLGALSDHFGRRPILLFSLLGLALDYLLVALAPSLGVLLVARIIAGITGANFTAANAYIADITPPEKRAQNFGLLGAVFGLGFILGPILGGFLGSENSRLPFYVAACLTALNWLYGFFILPESLKPENRSPFRWTKANPLASLYALSKLQNIGGLILMSALSNLAAFILQSMWILYTEFRFNWTVLDNGIALFCVGLVSAIVQGGLIRLILPRWGERRTIIVGLFVGFLSYMGYGLAQEGWMMYAIILLSFLGPIAGPAVQSIISKAVGERDQGSALGALNSLTSLVAVLAPLLGTALFARVTHLERSSFWIGAPFFLSGVLALISLMVVSYTFSKQRLNKSLVK